MANRQRLEKFKQSLRGTNIDVAMIVDPTSIAYLTNFLADPHERFMALFLDLRGERELLFVPALDETAAKEAANVSWIVPVSDTENPYDKVQDAIGVQPLVLGLEKNVVSVTKYEALQQALVISETHDIEPVIMSLRLRKTEEELVHIRKAVHMVEEVIRRALTKVKLGMTELELTAELEYQMKVLGGSPSFSTIVLSGPKSALPHGTPGDRAFERGDFLLLDLGVYVDGYCSDITRTFVLGEANEKQIEIYETVLAANEAGIAAAKVGAPLKTLDEAARQTIAAKGYGDYFTHRVGHGLGMEIHEAPSIHGQNEQPIETGLFFTIEPGIYVPDFGGVRIEDDIYMKEDGTYEVITSFPKQLTILNV